MHAVNRRFGAKPSTVLVTLAVLAAAAFSSLALGAPAAQACGGGQVCAWTGSFYSGSEWYLSCPGGPTPSWPIGFPESYSAKNNCGGQYIQIGWTEGGSTNWKACMNPGGDRPNPGRINTYRAVGSC